MALTSTTRIAWLDNKSKLSEGVKMENLEWCFRPMLICLRIFGIDFKWNQQRSYVSQKLISLICLFWLIVITLTIYGLGLELYENILKVEKTQYKIVSQKIKFFCLAVEIGGIYAASAFLNWKHGEKLVESFNQIVIHSEIDKKTHHQLRNTIIIAFFLSISTVTLTIMHSPLKGI